MVGRRHVSLYFAVGLGLMRSVVAASSIRTYQGSSGAWRGFTVRRCRPVFFQHCSDSMVNAWQLFEYIAYAVVTKKLQSSII